MRTRALALLALTLCGAAPARPAAPSEAAQPPAYDVVIRGGTIYDGSGGAPFHGDVAVRGDRIVWSCRADDICV